MSDREPPADARKGTSGKSERARNPERICISLGWDAVRLAARLKEPYLYPIAIVSREGGKGVKNRNQYG
jgi:hypothetical protein